MKIKEEKQRKFLGKTEFIIDIPEDISPEKKIERIEFYKREKHFYDRMLRAYLKGKEFFYFGYEYINNLRQPIKHKVEYSYT